MIDISNIEVAVLAGGKGTRLSSIVDDRPKPMAELLGRPFLEWILIYLRSLGFNKIVLCTGYKADYIEEHFGDGRGLGLDIKHSIESSPLGTGGAIRDALKFISSDRFFVLNGDSFCSFDPAIMIENHLSAGVKGTIWLVDVPDSGRFGSIKLGPDRSKDVSTGGSGNGSIVSFEEKSAEGVPGSINSGIYLLERSIIEEFPHECAISLEKEIFPIMTDGRLYGITGRGPFLDIGTPESYLGASDILGDILNGLSGI